MTRLKKVFEQVGKLVKMNHAIKKKKKKKTVFFFFNEIRHN